MAFIVRTPDNRQFKISPIARDILLQLDGRTTLDAVAITLNSRSIGVSAEELRMLMTTKYHPLGIVENPDEPFKPVRETERKIHLPFLLHWDLVPAKYVRIVSSRLTVIFSRPAALLALCSIIAAHYPVYFKNSDVEFLSGADFLHVLILCLLSVLWHEFGHSSAVSRYGGSPGKIGFGLFVFLPSFYADVSEIWRFSRKHRMIVDLGGVYFQQIFFAIIALAGVLTSNPSFFVVCRFIDLMVLLTLNPVVQFDGYWLLADWLALPNLYRLATNYIAGWVKRVLVPGRSATPLPLLPRDAYVAVVIYSVASNLFLAGIIWMSYRYIYSTFTKIHVILPAIFDSMLIALKANDLALFVSRLVTLFFAFAFPATALVGLYRYSVILIRYCARKTQAIRLARKCSTIEGSSNEDHTDAPAA